MLCRRGLLPVLVVFVIIGISGVFLLSMNWIDRQQQHYRQHTEALKMAYRAALNGYQLATDIYLRDTIRQPDVLGIFSQAWHADDAEKDRLRQRLYHRLNTSYQTLWQHRLRQLHFHLPDGESFLRFHKPTRFGDKLFSVRPSVQIANVERREVIGFEAGRIIDGFRFVSPLEYHGVHIGSVETSIPFRSVQEAMASFADGREYQCLIRADLVQERLFPDYRANYAPSLFSPEYLVENPQRRQPDSSIPLSTLARQLEGRLGRDTAIAEQLGRGVPFSIGVIQKSVGYVVSFMPIQEVTGRLGGYLVCYAQEPMVVALQRSYLVELTVFFVLLGAAFWLLVRWRCSVAQLAEQTAHMQYEETLLMQQERVEHEERVRISRELHDSIGQVLLGVNLRLKLLQEEMSPDKADERRALGQLIKDVQQASAELRNLVVSLRPLPLAGMQVDEAIQWLCRNLEKNAGVSLLLQATGDFTEISDSCSLVLFRACQEGLANIQKHAAAKRVQVSLQQQADHVTLTIQDDGVGGADAEHVEGSGLAIIRDRVGQAGGRMQIDSPTGAGTRLFVELPCH